MLSLHAVLPYDSRLAGRQRHHRASTALLGRAAAVGVVMVFAVWVLTSEQMSTYMQPQSNLQWVHGVGSTDAGGSSASSSSSNAFAMQVPAGSGALQDSSRTLYELAGDDWDYNTYSEPAAFSLSTMRDTSGMGSMQGLPPAASSHARRSSWSKALMARFEAEKRRAQDPAYRAKLQAAAATPLKVVIMSGLFWEMNENSTKGCSVDGVPLDCRFTTNQGDVTVLDAADALYYHVPAFTGQPRAKAFPNQLRVAMSLESSTYYSDLDDPRFMCQFDAEMTYRHCSQIINWYSLEKFARLFKDPTVPLVPFEEKMHAIAYVNSNCGAQSGRSDILRQLMALGDKAKIPVHSYGGCDRNMEWPDNNPSKFAVFSKYKYCVTMENSLSADYITEKLWDGLVAGCVPVYLGPKTARDIVPDPHSFIMYDAKGGGDASTPEELDALMDAIGKDKQRYEAMLAWKHRQPQQQPNALFRHLWDIQHTSGECFLCQFLARHRANPQPQYDTCLFNRDWMEAANQLFVPQEQACAAVQPPASALSTEQQPQPSQQLQGSTPGT